MEIREMDRKASAVLKQWDPFQEGKDAYELEIVDVVAALHRYDDPVDLAKSIREIYEHTFKLWIPIEKCIQISYQLLAIKYKAKSIV